MFAQYIKATEWLPAVLLSYLASEVDCSASVKKHIKG